MRGAICLALLLLPGVLLPEAIAQQEEGELTSLCRALQEKDSPAHYEQLAAFAREHATAAEGSRAALVLGYRDYTHGRFEQAAAWLARAEAESSLTDYTLYWEAQNDQAQHRTASALDRLDRLVRDHPASAILPQAMEALAGIALEAGEAQRARFALESYKGTEQRPALLLLRARAREVDRAASAAASDLVSVY